MKKKHLSITEMVCLHKQKVNMLKHCKIIIKQCVLKSIRMIVVIFFIILV